MMRTPLVIAGLVVGAIGIEFMHAWIRPVRLLPMQLCADIGSYGMNASWFLIPAVFVFAPAAAGSKRNWVARVLLSVLTSWYSVIQFRMAFNLPALRELAYQRDAYMYDGVGLNAALFVMGWIPPLVVTVILILACETLSLTKKAVQTAATKPDLPNEATEPADVRESPS